MFRLTHTVFASGRQLVVVAIGLACAGGASAYAGQSPAALPAGTWEATAPMSVVRSGHTATRLPDGRVLVTGGGTSNEVLASAEIYDPASRTWSLTGPMRMVRGAHTATLLPNGGVLSPAHDSLLARNVEGTNFDRRRIFSGVGAIGAFSQSDAAVLRGGMAAGLVDAWLVHLAEGVRDVDRRTGDATSSRAEFAELKMMNLLTDASVVVHGVGLEPADFAEMAHAPAARASGAGDGRGAKLVWSPLSNLLLYGQTAAVYDALAAGALVSLGTDWTPERIGQPVDRAEGGRSNIARPAAARGPSRHHAGARRRTRRP